MRASIHPSLILFSLLLFADSCKRECDAGWEGYDCNIEQREKFTGIYNGDVLCGVSPNTYTLWISKTAGEDVQYIDILNIDDRNLTYTGKVDGQSIDIAEQTKSGIKAKGSGTLTGDTLVIQYTITDSSGSKNCTFRGIR